MASQYLKTRDKPRRTLIRREFQGDDHGVRVYRSSPEDVSLQIRRGKDFMMVNLSFDEARQIAALLEEEATRV